jgi:hypothetical protein
VQVPQGGPVATAGIHLLATALIVVGASRRAHPSRVHGNNSNLE